MNKKTCMSFAAFALLSLWNHSCATREAAMPAERSSTDARDGERRAAAARVEKSGLNRTEGGLMSLERALSSRRSVRAFASRKLRDDEVMKLLWAAQGITAEGMFRTAPSAGATYPLEIHAVTRDAVLRYAPEKKAVSELFTGNVMDDLADAALGQPCVRNAAANFVIGGVVSRTAARYGDRAGRYVDIEAGCAGQNLMLMATSLGLGSVMVGAFDDETVRDIALLPKDSIALAIISVGAPK